MIISLRTKSSKLVDYLQKIVRHNYVCFVSALFVFFHLMIILHKLNVIMIFITSLCSGCGRRKINIFPLYGIVLGALHEQMWMASIKR
jgi:hypothetical protein